jgi:CBS domain-containing protein
MRVRDVMTLQPVTIRVDDTISLAAQMMVWNGIRHLPVLDGEKIAGILTERDILRHRAAHPEDRPMAAHVSDAMSTPPETVHPETPLNEAADAMATARLGCLAVVDSGRLTGILTTTDLLGEEARASFRKLFVPEDIGHATAEHLMTPSPLTADPEEPLADAIARMTLAQVHQLPVTSRGRLVGLLCKRDIVLDERDWAGTARSRWSETLRVSTLMETDVPTVKPSCPIVDLVKAFADWRIGTLPVVAGDERLVGIISYVDVLRAIGSPGGGRS